MVGTTLFVSSSSSGFWIVLFCLAGIAIGTGLFFNGFRMLRYKRLILDTPLSRVHSASIGLVEITGSPTGPKTLTAPVTGDPCFYYRVQAWQWEESGKNHRWKRVLDESLYLPFFLEDGSGRVLIDPQGAEMDVHRSFSDEIDAGVFSRDILPRNVRNFLVKRGLVPYEKIKIEERIIEPEFPLFVFGTLGENRSWGSWWEPRPHLDGGGASPFNIQFGGGPGLEIKFRSTRTRNQVGPLSGALVNALTHIPGAQVTRFEMQRAPGGGSSVLSVAGAEALQRLDKTVPAGTTASSIAAVMGGNPPANPSDPAFDLHPSVAISKGERGDPFTISWHSQKEVVRSLAWKSTLYIWGGPILAIMSLYFLLLFWEVTSL